MNVGLVGSKECKLKERAAPGLEECIFGDERCKEGLERTWNLE